MDPTLLATKLYIPQRQPNLVSRKRLLLKLQDGLQQGCRLTLVAAPAGYGKTTLVAEWVREQNLPTAWVALDEGDNDGVRFLNYLIAALQAIQPGLAEAALKQLQSSQSLRIEALLAQIINDITTISKKFLIIFDDYHLIQSQDVHKAMLFLLDHLPPQVHLVIVTRADPPLPVARLRGRGQLNELRLSDLRFTQQESVWLVEVLLGWKLPEEAVTELTARTEGWAAGLQMVSLALQSDAQAGQDIHQFLANFSGSHRFILDYLLEEVIQRQPEQIQAFFMHTAVLDRMCASLCDALTRKEGESQAILEALEHANLFIIPLDNRREWYRYHQLFADLLKARLLKIQPNLAPKLHQRACQWLLHHGAYPEAIQHALAAEDFNTAADLIEQEVEATLNRSHIVTFMRWVEALPEIVLKSRLKLGVLYAWGMLISGKAIQNVEERLVSLQGEADQLELLSAPLRSYIALMQGDGEKAVDLSRWAMRTLPESERFLRGMAVLCLATAYMAEYESEEGLRILEEAAQISRQTSNVMVTVLVLLNIAEQYYKIGQLHKAQQAFQEAVEMATDEQGRYLPIAFRPLAGLANLARERNDLAEASRLLAEAETISGFWMQSGALMPLVHLARIRLVLGDEAGTQRILDYARRVASKTAVTKLDDYLVAMFQAQVWIRQGKLDLAEQWARDRNIEIGPGNQDNLKGEERYLARLWKYEALIFVRLLLAQQAPHQALSILDLVQPGLEKLHRISALIEALLLRALVLKNLGENQAALTILRRGVTLAEPEGYVRTFLDEGKPARRLLETLFRQVDQQDFKLKQYLQKLLNAFEQSSPTTALAPGRVRLQPAPDHLPAVAEPEVLSARELDVLRLLQSSLSAEQLASELVISVHTVRSHIKNIYSKLGVHSRLEAIEQAEELKLL